MRIAHAPGQGRTGSMRTPTILLASVCLLGCRTDPDRVLAAERSPTAAGPEVPVAVEPAPTDTATTTETVDIEPVAADFASGADDAALMEHDPLAFYREEAPQSTVLAPASQE